MVLDFDGDRVTAEHIETRLKGSDPLKEEVLYNTVTYEPQVYEGAAPEDGMQGGDPLTGYPPPHVVYFNQSAGSNTLQALEDEVTWQNGLWSVLVVGPQGDIDRVDRAKLAVKAALAGSTGTVPSGEGYIVETVLEGTVWQPPQDVDGVLWVRQGYIFRVLAQPPLP